VYRVLLLVVGRILDKPVAVHTSEQQGVTGTVGKVRSFAKGMHDVDAGDRKVR
jgi:hypothetical protein